MIRVHTRIKNGLTCAKKLFAFLLLLPGLAGCSSAARYIATLSTELAVITTPTHEQDILEWKSRCSQNISG